MLGRVIGRYHILEPLGQGGMGRVYLGRHVHLGRAVAVKVLAPAYAADPAMRARFLQEATLQVQFTHPHVVQVLDYLVEGEELFLVMEYVEGATLAERLARAGRLAPREAVHICHSVLAALAFMHAKGVIHRDIKPSNIMLTAEGVVKVTDFGIAKVTDAPGLTQTGMRLGTVGYMAPEQLLRQPAGVPADLYALGVTLYEMVTGRRPFAGDSEYALVKAQLETEPPSPGRLNPAIAPALSRVILQALAKAPERRYQTAGAFQVALTRLRPPPPSLWKRLLGSSKTRNALAPSVLKRLLLTLRRPLQPRQLRLIGQGGAVVGLLSVALYIFLPPTPRPRQPLPVPAVGAPEGSAPAHTKLFELNLTPKLSEAEARAKGTMMPFVLIPAGKFMMGSNTGKPDEQPVREVWISQPFYLGQYEVTLAQWQAVMRSRPVDYTQAARPVVKVSWDDVQEFIRKLNDNDAKGNSYALPTEAEWEYAARATSTTAYSFGDEVRQQGADARKPHIWCRKDYILPVTELAANLWGLHGMHGNASEWVRDLYRPTYSSNSPVTDPVIDPPVALPAEAQRVRRGGDWQTAPQDCRSSSRHPGKQHKADPTTGFRLRRRAF